MSLFEQFGKSKKNKKLSILVDILRNYSLSSLRYTSNEYKEKHGVSLHDILNKDCLKKSFIGITIRMLTNPYAHYAINLKRVLDTVGYFILFFFCTTLHICFFNIWFCCLVRTHWAITSCEYFSPNQDKNCTRFQWPFLKPLKYSLKTICTKKSRKKSWKYECIEKSRYFERFLKNPYPPCSRYVYLQKNRFWFIWEHFWLVLVMTRGVVMIALSLLKQNKKKGSSLICACRRDQTKLQKKFHNKSV